MFNVNRVKRFSINGYNNCWAVSLGLKNKKGNSRVVLTAGHNVYNRHEGEFIRKDILIGKARNLIWKVPCEFIKYGNNRSPGSSLYEFPLGFTGISGSAVFNRMGEFMGIVCGLGTYYGSKEKQTNRGIMIPTSSIISIINNGGINLISQNFKPDI